MSELENIFELIANGPAGPYLYWLGQHFWSIETLVPVIVLTGALCLIVRHYTRYGIR